MAGIFSFETHLQAYEKCFDEYDTVYRDEAKMDQLFS